MKLKLLLLSYCALLFCFLSSNAQQSWTAFPTGTKLRVLVRATVGGTHYVPRAGFKDEVSGIEFLRVVLEPSCPLGHHVFADSANNGPVGQALVTEFLPRYVETLRTLGYGGREAEKIIRKLRADIMPPPGSRRPTGDTLWMLAETMENVIDKAAPVPNPGPRGFQRLNRPEYEHVVHDLLGVPDGTT